MNEALKRLKAKNRFHLEEEDDLFKEVTADEYNELKQERATSNFIDGGEEYGYKDDGEEDDWGEEKAKRNKKIKKMREKKRQARLNLKKKSVNQKKTKKPINTISFGNARMANPFSAGAAKPRQVDPVKTQTLMESVLAKIDDMFDDDDEDEQEEDAMEVDRCELSNTLNKGPNERAVANSFGTASKEKWSPLQTQSNKRRRVDEIFPQCTPIHTASGVVSTLRDEKSPNAIETVKNHAVSNQEANSDQLTPGDLAPESSTPGGIISTGPTPGGPVLPPVTKDLSDDDIEFNNFTQAESPSIKSTKTSIASGDEKVPPDLEGRVNMYWYDAYEDAFHLPGTIFLFGKAQKPGSKELQSCCLCVDDMLRTMYFLPRKGSTPEDVFHELNDIRKRLGIKKFMTQPKEMKYAFREGADVPTTAIYLKVCYSYKNPNFPKQFHSGKTYSHCFGSRASAMERFLLERKLMGPGWIHVPERTCSQAVSWADLEYVCHPHEVERCEGLNFQAPRLKVMSIAMQSLQDGRKQHEIGVLSYVCHESVNVEGETTQQDTLTSLSLVRKWQKHPFPQGFEAQVKTPKVGGRPVKTFSTERELLSFFLMKVKKEDPDIICGHNLFEWLLDLLLNRIQKTQVSNWSRIGRLRKKKFPFSKNGKLFKKQLTGRLYCDTYLSAQEFTRERKYSLAHLAETQLKPSQKPGVKPQPPPRVRTFDTEIALQKWVNAQGLVEIIREMENHAWIAVKLMFKLAIIPLSRELTKLCGNLWARSLQGLRAERNEFLLLHEFNSIDYIVPEKYSYREKIQLGIIADKTKGTKRKPEYEGGLVLEPKRGFYDTIVLLLDFNSLYPSIIQEYNLCFTTFNHWEVSKEGGALTLPQTSEDEGVLPKVIGRLLDRRKSVKQLLKKERDPERKKSLDIRQKALKLIANSMYGCLGFPNSRFYCKPIAFSITALGRENLKKAAEKAEEVIGVNNQTLTVIYGDTDSIMIDTGIKYNGKESVNLAMGKGREIKKLCNKLYKKMFLELDDVFSKMLLLRKKKYAALKVEGDKMIREVKGLDQVRRDWSLISSETSNNVLNFLFNSTTTEKAVEDIHEYLRSVRRLMDENKILLKKFQITKKLTKAVGNYKNKNQAHVQIAKRRLQNGKPVQVGMFISYIICTSKSSKDSFSMRAYTAEEVLKSHETKGGVPLEIDREWYLTNQILPPVQRLCDVIKETSLEKLADCLGLDSTKYKGIENNGGSMQDMEEDDEFEIINLNDYSAKYAACSSYKITCGYCKTSFNHYGVFKSTNTSSLECPTPNCEGLVKEEYEKRDLARLQNQSRLAARTFITKYYDMVYSCTDTMCRHTVNYVPAKGFNQCTIRGCTGGYAPLFSEKLLHNELSNIDFLFNIKHAIADKTKSCSNAKEAGQLQGELSKNLTPLHERTFDGVNQLCSQILRGSAYQHVLTEDIFGEVWGKDSIERETEDKLISG